MPNSDDDWLIEDDEAATTLSDGAGGRRWRVLIVDDDLDVHAVTRLALRNVSFKGRELELFSAYSGAQAYQVLHDTPDIALVLLDVVMETDDAGLVLARRIREELGNRVVRVVLRTGQPGQAPEQRLIVEYDINDYKAKTELTTQKLFTTVISALRACESLMMLERSRIGLGMILAGAANLLQLHSLRQFASGVLHQVSAVLDAGDEGLLCVMADRAGGPPAVIAASGAYAGLAEHALLPPDHPLLPGLARSLADKDERADALATTVYFATEQHRELCFALTPPCALGAAQRELLALFAERFAAAFGDLAPCQNPGDLAPCQNPGDLAPCQNPGDLAPRHNPGDLAPHQDPQPYYTAGTAIPPQ